MPSSAKAGALNKPTPISADEPSRTRFIWKSPTDLDRKRRPNPAPPFPNNIGIHPFMEDFPAIGGRQALNGPDFDQILQFDDPQNCRQIRRAEGDAALGRPPI